MPPAAAGLALVVLTIAAYLPALRNGFVWDDDSYVTANVLLRTAGGLWRIWTEPGAVPQYYPLTFSTFWIEYHLWGVQPIGYHLVNILLHVATVLLCWRVLVLLEVPGAWAAAAIFAVHPVHVESVAWITERKNVLSGPLALGALLAYLRFAVVVPSRWCVRDWLAYGLALALFAGALLSKTVTCALPAVLLLLVWWRRGRLTWRDVAPLVPFFLGGAALAAVTVWMETGHVGAAGAEWGLSFVGRVLLAGRALWFYAASLVWPVPLSFVYPRWRIDPTRWTQYLFPLAAVATLAALWLARRPLGKGAVVAALSFAGCLLPALGFFNIYLMRYTFVADHFAYHASLAFIAGLTAASMALLARAGARREIGLALVAIVLATLGALTWQRCGAFRDAATLWTDALAKNPEAYLAHNNLGTLLLHGGHVREAVAHYNEAIRLRPDDPEPRNNLGNALMTDGRVAEAVVSYEAALRLQPSSAEAHANLANALATQGRLDDAIEYFRTAVRLNPESASAQRGLGNGLAASGRADEAIAAYRDALRLDTHQADVHNNLGVLLLQQGHIDEAAAEYDAALQLTPASAEAHTNLANALTRQQRPDEAIAHYQAAARIQPNRPELRYNLGSALAAAGQLGEAETELRTALGLQPEFPEARAALEKLLASKARLPQSQSDTGSTEPQAPTP